MKNLLIVPCKAEVAPVGFSARDCTAINMAFRHCFDVDRNLSGLFTLAEGYGANVPVVLAFFGWCKVSPTSRYVDFMKKMHTKPWFESGAVKAAFALFVDRVALTPEAGVEAPKSRAEALGPSGSVDR